MQEAIVSLVRCDSYDGAQVAASVARACELLGGAAQVASPGQSVFVKSNAVIAAAPDSGIVTHPAVVRAVVEQFQRVTGRVTLGDSPGGPFNQPLLKRVYEKTGLGQVARDTGASLALDTDSVEVPFPEGVSIKRLTLCRAMVEADCLVSVSKFKTHRYMNVTGPVKNLYGTVPGTTKFVYHSRFDDEQRFANLIVDVHLAARPAFHVLDAVEVIEGEGSRKGVRRNLGVIAASRNAFALESLILALAGLTAADSRPLAAALERGLCVPGTDWLTVVGDEVAPLAPGEFVLPGSNFFSERVPALVAERFSRMVAVTPEPQAGSCTGCGVCAAACTRGAITVSEGLARVDAKRCIRCYCCDELCEQRAIVMRKPLLMRLVRKGGG